MTSPLRPEADQVRQAFAHCAVRVLLALVLSGASVVALDAQARGEQAEPAPSEISGRVVDDVTREPLSGATVRLERLGGDGGGHGDSSRVTQATVSDLNGAYSFRGLSAGVYRVHVSRIGYLSNSSLEVEVGQGVDTPGVSIALALRPIRLDAIRVTGGQSSPFVRANGRQIGSGEIRTRLARRRQDEFLVGDARQLTRMDVEQAITLAENDIFRALQRIPGVNTRDDFTATLWTRGAQWDQTRVYFDGLPLYNPTHAGWMFSSINPDAVGDLNFFPGYRPARWAEGGAAVLDVKTRRPLAGERVSGAAEVSVSSAKLTLEGRALDDNLGWLISARRTYLDLISGMAASLSGSDDLYVPFDFSDVVGRLDGTVGALSLEASGIMERDNLRGDIARVIRGNEADWGNVAGRISAAAPVGGLTARATLGTTHFETQVRRIGDRATQDEDAVTLPALRNSIDHWHLSLEVEPRHAANEPRSWAVGYQFVSDSVAYEGPFSLLNGLGSRLPDEDPEPLFLGRGLEYSAFWAERRWSPAEWLTLNTDLRWEFGSPVENGGSHRIAPRFAAQVRPTRSTSLSASWSRSFQYVQDVAPIAGPVGPELHISSLWQVAADSRDLPALRADVVTGGVERWFGSDWLASVNLYRRLSTGLQVANPLEGAVGSPERTNPDALADNEAWGLELGASRLAGRWTGSIGYAYSVSDLDARVDVPGEDVRRVSYPSPADVRHSIDATAMALLSDRVRIGSAFTFVSGLPFTRIVITEETARLSPANASRTPQYASLDLLFDYAGKMWGLDVTAYLQLRNALNRDNRVTYEASVEVCPGQTATSRISAADCDQPLIQDRFDSGLPRLPLVGVRVVF